MTMIVPLWAQGNTVTAIVIQALSVASDGTLSTSGSAYSFSGKATTYNSEHEEELEEFTPLDIFGKQWSGTSQDDTYNITEQLSRVAATNFLRAIWFAQTPGARYVQVTISADGETDSFVGYFQRFAPADRARGRNTASAVIKRTNYTVLGVFQANPGHSTP